MTATGHRTAAHTADLRIESWAPTREECMTQSALGLVDSFADIAGARPRRDAGVRLSAASDADLLAAILEEIIYRLDAHGEIPVTVTVRPERIGRADDRRADGAEPVVLELGLAGLVGIGITGAVPKAVSLYELRCAPDESGQWFSSVTVDV